MHVEITDMNEFQNMKHTSKSLLIESIAYIRTHFLSIEKSAVLLIMFFYPHIGSKVLRGMTENPNETLCATQFSSPIKRQLSSSTCNDVALCFSNGNEISSQLTDSNLKYNVQIVLENLKRNADKIHLNDKTNNNNIDISSQSNLINHLNGAKMTSPVEADYNSNAHIGPLQQLGCSIASSQDFTHDNSDYQWFLDYG